MLDRHFLAAIESSVCVGAVQDWDDSRSPCDGLKLVLAQQFDNALNFRELPCSLLRLYFAGRLRFRRFVRQLSTAHLRDCVHLAQLDQFTVDDADDGDADGCGMDEETADYCSPEYDQQCRRVERYWQLVLNLLFRSFESCLLGLMQRAATGAPFLSVDLVESLRLDPYWADFPACTAAHGDQWIYLTLLWRVNTTLVLERVLQPWETDECHEWLLYKLKLFRASHLDLLTAMVRANCYSDAELHRRGLLAQYWPASHRICCAEEMPDFICYATDNFKTGTNLKERNTRDDKFGHLFINKTSPNICKIRNMFDITIRYGEEDPVIYEAMMNILLCVLLGHLPRARGSLSCMAQIKINAFFAHGEANREISEAQWTELTRNKSLKRKKNGAGELQFRKTLFKLWLLLLRHFVLFLLKEWLLYIAESSGYFDKICNTTYKWPRGKELIRLGNGNCRALLSRQTAPGTPFDWSVIEFEEKSNQQPSGQKKQSSGGGGEEGERACDVKSGEIKKYHHWSLKMASKIKKDDFAKILLKKMTGTEKHVTLAQLESEFFLARPGDATRKMTLDEFHFICWYMSLNKSSVLETRCFQWMGMSLYALSRLRSWQFLYYVYDVPDNSFNEPICEMRDRSMRDYMLLKCTLRTIEYYRNKQYVYHLPLDYFKQQAWVMRRTLGIADHERTPPHLGIVYQCRGCMRFANSVVLLDPPAKPVPHNQKKSPAPSAKTRQQQQQQKRKSAPQQQKKPSQQKQQQQPVQQPSHSFMCKAFYNVEDGQLYCMKKQNPFTRVQALDLDRPMITVMRKLDGSILINTNKQVEVHTSNSNNASNDDARKAPVPQRSFLFDDRNLREQTERKLEWLMQTSVHEMLGGAADVEEPQQSGEAQPDATAKKTGSATTGKKKDGVKKLIQQRIDEVIVREGHDCQAPLMRVNMLGIMKNGKVLCTKCGLMTELTNRNMTADGSVICNRHKPPEAPVDKTHVKYHMHPSDVAKRATRCHFCTSEYARMRVPVQDEQLALRKLQLCKDCFDVCRSVSRTEIASLARLERRFADGRPEKPEKKDPLLTLGSWRHADGGQ